MLSFILMIACGSGYIGSYDTAAACLEPVAGQECDTTFYTCSDAEEAVGCCANGGASCWYDIRAGGCTVQRFDCGGGSAACEVAVYDVIAYCPAM